MADLSYNETLAYLYASQPAFHQVGAAAYKPGLQNTIALMAHLGQPHMAFPSVHVAGTNGKGSTAHLIAAVLQAAGLKVGLYTSPHLVDFRERIRINGQMIPQQLVVDYVASHRSFLEDLRPSFFESTMGLAFCWFAQEKVDIAVIEVGLGGRLDSTNIITPLLSVITNIGLDHTDFLGNTLAQIAAEKAGIIKPGVPCVIGETTPETKPVFLARAAECGILAEGLETSSCRLWLAEQCGYLQRRRRLVAPECELHGAYQQKNMQTAFVALSALFSILREKDILPADFPYHAWQKALHDGFAQVCKLTGLQGRWQVLAQKPLIICDTGHNAHGIASYVEQLRTLHAQKAAIQNASQSDNSHLRIVFGMVADKDIDAVLPLLPKEAHFYWTQPHSPRALPAEQIRLKGLTYGLIGLAYDRVEQAIAVALHDASENDIIFIGGSNYVVGEALANQLFF